MSYNFLVHQPLTTSRKTKKKKKFNIRNKTQNAELQKSSLRQFILNGNKIYDKLVSLILLKHE